MERRERKNAVTVLAPAKLNLALDVVGLLPNGYHALDMTMQTITLYERVMLRRSAGLSLRLPGSLVQPNDKNTAIKAALAFFHYTGLLAGVDITIYKNTPVRAGMAGGSADAAAVLVGLNALYGAKLSMSELCALGAGIGADVPFALMGGTCRVQGVGDLLKALPPVPDCWFTVVMPDYGVSTPEAFAAYDTVGSSTHPDCEAQEKAIRAGDLDAVCAAAGNALEECSGAKDNERYSCCSIFWIFSIFNFKAKNEKTIKLNYNKKNVSLFFKVKRFLLNYAFFAISAISANAFGSLTAISANIFLFIVTLAFLRPAIILLYVVPFILAAALILVIHNFLKSLFLSFLPTYA